MLSSHKDLREVLIHGLLGVSGERHILDDDLMVDLEILLGGIEHPVGFEDVIYAASLGDLLRTELLLRREILSIIVAQVIVTHYRSTLDSCSDEEVSNGGFDFGLACFEIITNDKNSLFGG